MQLDSFQVRTLTHIFNKQNYLWLYSFTARIQIVFKNFVIALIYKEKYT